MTLVHAGTWINLLQGASFLGTDAISTCNPKAACALVFLLLLGHVLFFMSVAHSGLGCLGVALVPWSLGALVFGCGSWKVTNTAKSFARPGLMQMTTFVVLEMLRILSTTAF